MNEILIFLSRIATEKIGVVEATLLVAAAKGATNSDLELLTGLPKQTVWSGTNSLRKKGLITYSCQPSGKKIHNLTAAGRAILDKALGAA